MVFYLQCSWVAQEVPAESCANSFHLTPAFSQLLLLLPHYLDNAQFCVFLLKLNLELPIHPEMCF